MCVNMSSEGVTFQNILEARNRIASFVVRTPTYPCVTISQELSADVYLKLEVFQPIRVFKIRGAFNKVCSLSPEERENGVVAASSGNHGLAVAYAAKTLGIKAIICVPEKAVEEKVKAIEGYGAEIIKFGKDYDEAYSKALEIQSKTKTAFVHAFNDPFVIAGQGTIGLELLEDVPDLDTIIIPIGGGGLLSGVATAAKTMKPNVRIVGVQAEGASAYYQSWKAGKIVELDSVHTVADGLAARKPMDLAFGILRRYVDDILLVSEDEIGEAVLTYLHKARLLVEPSGAASLAALLFKYHPKPKEKIALITSGGNISVNYLITLLKA